MVVKITRPIDSKDVLIQAPKNSGSLYFKYKGIFLMAACYAHYR